MKPSYVPDYLSAEECPWLMHLCKPAEHGTRGQAPRPTKYWWPVGFTRTGEWGQAL
ncbi:MAG: hypothetical protein RQM92_05615 [Candidatus Syntrophopropionicum ammoniitolerans]